MDAFNDFLVGRYQLLEELARGRDSLVCKARVLTGKHEGRFAAVKLSYVGGDFSEMQRRERESIALSRLKHSRIPEFFEARQVGARYYATSMSLIEGGSLRQRLTDNGVMTETELRSLASQLIDLLCYLEYNAVVHRDLKPGNLIITDDDHLFLVDFGLAKSALGDDVTRTGGTIRGTPGFWSPEQILNEGRGDLDCRTDVFSLGCTLYYAAIKKVPFGGQSYLETIADILSGKNFLLGELKGRGLSKEFCMLVSRCLEVNKDKRPSPIEVLAEFQQVFTSFAKKNPRPASLSISQRIMGACGLT